MPLTQNGVLKKDDNDNPVMGGTSSADNATIINSAFDPITRRLLTDSAAGSGTVTSVSVVTANGFAGSVATATTTPAITLSTTITGVLKGNGTAISAALNSDLPVMTATVGGAVPTPPNNTTTFLRGDGTFATPAGGGTVTSVSVVSANGFAGSVATDTTTPAITLTTSITGILKGNGTAISAATAGSDYAVGSIGLAGGQTIAGSTLTNENLTLRANAADLTTGQVNVTSSKEATNTTTASVALAGGLAVAKRVYALDMTVTNAITGSVTGNAGTASAVAVGGITGLGTGVATALAVNVGSAGAFVTFNGALGTPSSGTVTNLTGTASININGTVGATTPAAGTFTTLVAGSTTSLLLGTAGSAVGNIGFRNATSGTITLAPVTGALGTVTLTLPAVTDTVQAIAATQTITNKRQQPRIVSAASYTTDTGTSLDISTTDIFVITAQAGALLFNAPGGTPVQGEKLIIRIKDNGTARALTWNAVFRAMGTALPSTTVLSKTLYLGFFYNSTDTKWDLVASAQEA